MKGILKKLRTDVSKKKQRSEGNQINLNHLNSYQTVQHRALVGWVVSRCAAALQLDESEREALFFLAFTTESFDQLEDGIIKELMLLANSAVEWMGTDRVIEEELKSVNSSFLGQDVLTRVFSEIQSDVKTTDMMPTECDTAWEVYRDVIYAATHGNFLLINKDDIARYKNGNILCEIDVKQKSDISKAREAAKEVFEQHKLHPSQTLSYNLIISEAVTNILKHAEYGKMSLYECDDSIHVVVEDKGPGIPLKILPKTTLTRGFSTKESLGHGFTLMMKLANQIILETSSTGSTLILVLDGSKKKQITNG